MRYICSKNYKILCKEDCYHVKNIKEENKVWFDTIEEGLGYGCRLCKHCMSNIVTIPSGSVLTKEQTDVVYEFAKILISGDKMWVDCKDCIYFQEGDCENAESRDGCCFGVTEEKMENNT